jgi:hypothetical protein
MHLSVRISRISWLLLQEEKIWGERCACPSDAQNFRWCNKIPEHGPVPVLVYVVTPPGSVPNLYSTTTSLFTNSTLPLLAFTSAFHHALSIWTKYSRLSTAVEAFIFLIWLVGSWSLEIQVYRLQCFSSTFLNRCCEICRRTQPLQSRLLSHISCSGAINTLRILVLRRDLLSCT